MSSYVYNLNKKTESIIKNLWTSSFVEDRKLVEDSEVDLCFEENFDEIAECLEEVTGQIMVENNIDDEADIPVCS